VVYLLGKKVARPFISRHGRFLLLSPTRLQAIEAFFARHGNKTILFARFISGIRVVAALFAGLSGMRWRIFALYNVAGALLWATAMGLLGFFFGQSWSLLEKWVGLGGLIALGAVAFALLLLTLLHHARALRASLTAFIPRALGRREAVVLLANLTFLALFSKAIEDVVSGEATRFDRVLLAAIHDLSGPLMNTFFRWGSALGSAPVIILAVAVLVLLWLRRGARREAQALLAATGIAEGVTWILLYTVRRAHPDMWEVLVYLHRYSFPSGHTLVATAAYGMAAYLLGELRPAFRHPAQWGAAVLIGVIGISRIGLGANWPTDVLAGFAGGFLILWATLYWYEGNYSVVLQGLALFGKGAGLNQMINETSRTEPGEPGRTVPPENT
ncbi:MAG TPA: bifunctional DedA family/phosphatase PAP2 family protein, partial [Candidatus Methylomirabilis sp.]|nr:bifunctional DedA family/phosphatase PAP2 family protein [Candidatus Methylomirabilis sp.]